MIVIDDGVAESTRLAPVKKERPSEKHKVLLHQPVNRDIPCTVCLLKTVFQMSDQAAVRHAERARKYGVEPVYAAIPEIAESMANAGNAAAQVSSKTCYPRAKQVKFTTDREP